MGLDELLSDIQSIEANPPQNITDTQLLNLSVEQVFANPEQPRKLFDEEKLKELAESIRVQGVIQPIIVKPLSEGKYQIVAGERRFRASQIAHLKTIPAIVRNLSDEAVIVLALIENIQRHDLNPVEEAKALQRLVEEFYITHQKLAEMLGKSRVSITHSLRLLSLDIQVRNWLEQGLISVGHAKLLLPLNPSLQIQMANTMIEKSLSVRQAEQMIQKVENHVKTTKTRQEKDPDILNIQSRLSEKLGAPVTINHTKEGKGKLTIQYHTLDELEGILTHISF